MSVLPKVWGKAADLALKGTEDLALREDCLPFVATKN